MASPMPLVPPVTSARLPLNSLSKEPLILYLSYLYARRWAAAVLQLIVASSQRAHPAVDHELAAHRERGFVGRQEDDGLGDFRGIPEASDGNLAHEVGFRQAELVVERRRDRAG